MRKKFLRTHTNHFKRIGGKKKNLKWRKPRGRHNKIREGIKGKQSRPKIGMKKEVKKKTEIKKITCLKDVEMVEKGQEVKVSRVGKRKRIMILEKLKGKNAKILK
jgi:ribosomal protein L32E